MHREYGLGMRLGSTLSRITYTEDCKLVVTCKMQNRNATDKLNPQCSKLALFANTITGRITNDIVDLADQLHFYFAFCK